MRTNYPGHDDLYRRKRARGEAGWGDPETASTTVARAAAALRRRPWPADRPVLEIGCGNGAVTLALARDGWTVWGVDVAPSAVEWARDLTREAGLDVPFDVADVRDLPYPDGAFGAVVDGLCLHCVLGPDRALLLAEVRRVLAPGGLFVVQTMCGDPPPGMPQAFDPVTRCALHPDGFATRYFGRPDDLLAELGAAGFDVHAWTVVPASDRPDDTDTLIAEAARTP